MVKQLSLSCSKPKQKWLQLSVMVISDCHSHKKTFSSEYLCSPILSTASHTTCNRALPFLVPAPHAAHPPPSPGRAVVQHVLLHFASHGLHFPLQPHIPPVSAAQQGDIPLPFDSSPSCTENSPSPALPSLVSHLPGHHFFFKLHFTSKSRAQLLVWVQSQETLRSMGEGSWCISCFMWPVYQKLHWDQEQILHPHPSFTTAPSPRHSHSRGAGEMHNRTLAAHMPAANHQVQKEVGHQLCIPADPLKAHIAGAHLSHRALAPTQRKGEVVG